MEWFGDATVLVFGTRTFNWETENATADGDVQESSSIVQTQGSCRNAAANRGV